MPLLSVRNFDMNRNTHTRKNERKYGNGSKIFLFFSTLPEQFFPFSHLENGNAGTLRVTVSISQNQNQIQNKKITTMKLINKKNLS